jgi:hypothetical protein
MNPVDVRSPEDIANFENILKKGPITIVLVYADWCGHCNRYKDNVWNKLLNTPNRKANLASVHYDQLANTSQKNAAIKGYPSVLVVGTDKKAATFPDGTSKKTNAFPNAQSIETMEAMVTKDAKKILTAPKIVEDVEADSLNSFTNKRAQMGGARATATPKRKGGLLQALSDVIQRISGPLVQKTRKAGKTGRKAGKKTKTRSRRSNKTRKN